MLIRIGHMMNITQVVDRLQYDFIYDLCDCSVSLAMYMEQICSEFKANIFMSFVQ